MSGRIQALKMYKELLKEANKFNSYYYRNYFGRKIKLQFRKHMTADEDTSRELMKRSEDMLTMLRRQTVITNLYGNSKLVIEQSPSDNSGIEQQAERRMD